MNITFVVLCDETLPGQHIRVVGSDESLGSWCPEKGLRLLTSSELFPKWMSAPTRLPDTFEYKFVICDASGSLVKWEDRESNRSFKSDAGVSSACIEDSIGNCRFTSVPNEIARNAARAEIAEVVWQKMEKFSEVLQKVEEAQRNQSKNVGQMPGTGSNGGAKGVRWSQRCRSGSPRLRKSKCRSGSPRLRWAHRSRSNDPPLCQTWSKCEECGAHFTTQELLVDHQQAMGHWGPTLDNVPSVILEASTTDATPKQYPCEVYNLSMADLVRKALNEALLAPGIEGTTHSSEVWADIAECGNKTDMNKGTGRLSKKQSNLRPHGQRRQTWR